MSAMVPDLLRERSFRRYWTGQTVSLLGDQITFLAVPLAAVLVLHADAAQMGWLSMAGLLPALLFSLPAGAWADRRGRRRRTMIAADLLRAALMATLPVGYALGVLTLAQLYAVAFAVGTLAVVFDVCNATLFVSLVRPAEYVRGNALTSGSRAFSFVAGPSVGGLLVQILAAPLALLADAVSYLFSAGLLARIAPVEPPPAEPRKGHFSAGLRFIARSRVMRPLVAAAATVNFFNFVFHTLVVLYAVDRLGLNAGVLGLVIGAGAVGSVIGAVLTGRITRAIGVGPTVVLGFIGFPAPLILIPLAGGPEPLLLAAFFTAEFVSGFGLMLLDIGSGALQSAVIPDALRSRVSGAFRTVNYGVRPLGALVGGTLGSAIGLRPTLWIATVGGLLSVLWLLPSPIPRIRDLPDEEPDPSAPLGPKAPAAPTETEPASTGPAA
ncbi:Predicted arabinose efflux permease, MFS family [Actinacidiphila alni]|uniref:Predicted arabinose efflux permease, MFS family n=2 Tax=Actinacidiphila alni TaxID=380248 RepID=A0A1I2M915_9ACTN|nr:Predicted arabinose efflux permease, MFS family [Actinacidiphila alni]